MSNLIFQFVLSLIFVYLSFFTLRDVDFAKLLGITMQTGRILKMLLSIALGYLVAGFFFSIIQNIQSFSSSFH